jgi:hypothetical protein
MPLQIVTTAASTRPRRAVARKNLNEAVFRHAQEAAAVKKTAKQAKEKERLRLARKTTAPKRSAMEPESKRPIKTTTAAKTSIVCRIRKGMKRRSTGTKKCETAGGRQISATKLQTENMKRIKRAE